MKRKIKLEKVKKKSKALKEKCAKNSTDKLAKNTKTSYSRRANGTGQGGREARNFDGRPSKLTPERSLAICRAIRAGNWMEVAAEAAGISRFTMRNWIIRGNEVLDAIAEAAQQGRVCDPSPEERVYAQFVLDFEKAQAQGEMKDLARIEGAARKGIWQAAAWRLERRHPERWRSRQTVAHEGGDKPIEHKNTENVQITVEQRRTYLLGVVAALQNASDAISVNPSEIEVEEEGGQE